METSLVHDALAPPTDHELARELRAIHARLQRRTREFGELELQNPAILAEKLESDAFEILLAVESTTHAHRKLEDETQRDWMVALASDRIQDLQHLGSLADDLFDLLQRIRRDRLRFEELADEHRKVFNDSIRGLARPLTIAHVPDELLRQIFGHVNNDTAIYVKLPFYDKYDLHTCDTKSIKNVRLTCRRFCAASSHLLLPDIDVRINSASLARLNEISRHPTIAKGVRSVRVNLDYCRADVAVDERAFVDYVCTALGKRLDARLRYERTNMLYGNLPQELTDATQKALLTLDLWQCYRQSGWDTLRDDAPTADQASRFASISALCAGYQHYKQRYLDQEQLLVNGSFVKSVAEAMSRMPIARSLEMTDRNSIMRYQRPLFNLFTDVEVIDPEKCFMRTQQWEQRRGVNGATPSGHLLYALPTAIRHAEVSLQQLKIDISGFYSSHALELDESSHDSLQALAKTLNFLHYRGPPDLSEARSNSLFQYLSPLMSGDKLRSVSIKYCAEHSERNDIAPLLTLLAPQANLGLVWLEGCSLHFHELQRLMLQFQPQSTILRLHVAHLLSGTWLEVLDFLRETVHRDSSLVHPVGAECDNMSRDEYRRIFKMPSRDRRSYATDYITRRRWERNPLAPEDDEGESSSDNG